MRLRLEHRKRAIVVSDSWSARDIETTREFGEAVVGMVTRSKFEARTKFELSQSQTDLLFRVHVRVMHLEMFRRRTLSIWERREYSPAGIGIMCPDCAEIVGFHEFEFGNWIECEGACGRAFRPSYHYHRDDSILTIETIGLMERAVKKKLKDVTPSRSRIAVTAITKQEFQAVCGFVISEFNPVCEERGWFSDDTGSFLGILLHDKIDKTWESVVLARDEQFQFRAIDVGESSTTRDEARMHLQFKIADYLDAPHRIFPQE